MRLRIWTRRRRARLLSRYDQEQDVAALIWRGGTKFTVGLYRAGQEVKQ